jgi:hypothetical protein
MPLALVELFCPLERTMYFGGYDYRRDWIELVPEYIQHSCHKRLCTIERHDNLQARDISKESRESAAFPWTVPHSSKPLCLFTTAA